MQEVLQRAGTPALLEADPRFANLGERIVQAARMAVAEHLRQMGQTSFVIGGADHAAGERNAEPLNKTDREAA